MALYAIDKLGSANLVYTIVPENIAYSVAVNFKPRCPLEPP